MTDTPPSSPEASSSAARPGFLSKSNLTLTLAASAFVLALAPYVLPNIQSLIVRGGILARPETLMEGSKAYQTQQEVSAKAEVETAIRANQASLINKDDPVIGNPSGTITIIQFHDYLCGACRATHAPFMAFLKANPDVRVVIKEYPIIGKENSRFLASLALATRESGHYAAVYDAIYAHEMKSDADVDAALTAAGVNPAVVRAKASTPEVQARIDQTMDLGIKLGINATPNFIIDGVLVNGGDIPQLTSLVAAAREKAKK